MTLRHLKTSEQFQKKLDNDFCFRFFEPYSSRTDLLRTAGFNIFIEPLIAVLLAPISAIVALAFAAKAVIHSKNRIDNLKESRYFILIAMSSAIYACAGWVIRIGEAITRLFGTKQPDPVKKSTQEIIKVVKNTVEEMESDLAEIVAQV